MFTSLISTLIHYGLFLSNLLYICLFLLLCYCCLLSTLCLLVEIKYLWLMIVRFILMSDKIILVQLGSIENVSRLRLHLTLLNGFLKLLLSLKILIIKKFFFLSSSFFLWKKLLRIGFLFDVLIVLKERRVYNWIDWKESANENLILFLKYRIKNVL